MTNIKKRIVSMILALCMIFAMVPLPGVSAAVQQDDPAEIVQDGIAHGLSYLGTQSVSKYGDEWNIFTILRAGGSISGENRAAYLDSVEAKLNTGSGQPSDYARVILTLGVMGEDPESFRGYNLIEKLYTWNDLDGMTSNQISWTLLALDSKNYNIPEDAVNTRENLVKWLLAFQQDDGGFALSQGSDLDMTGMIMQALAPYNNSSHPEVQKAFEKALGWLREHVTDSAGFAATYSENSCSTAQILTGLCAAGIDPLDPDNGFTVGRENVVTNLYSYKAYSGFYWDPTLGDSGDLLGTQQVTYALEAYRRFAADENALYDLTDVNLDEDQKAALRVTKKVDALPAADKLKLTDKAAVEAARKAYNDLSEAEKVYITDNTLSKLTAAEAAIAKLEAAEQEAQEQAKAKAAFESGKSAVTVKATAYNQVKVTWNKYTNATSYLVYRKAAGASGWTKLGETTGTSYTDNKNLKGETTYYYTVKAVSTKWGGKTYSKYVTDKKVKTPVDPAKTTFQNGKPAVTAKAAAYNQVQVTWKKYTNATSYLVYRKTSGGSWKLLKETTSLSYTDKTAATGTTYYYTVKAVSTKWGGKVYSKYVTNVKAKTALTTPVISAVKNSKSKQAAVTWKKVSGASGYVVYRATSKNGTYKAVATIKSGSTVSCTNTGLTKGKTYYYKVRAYRTVSGKNVYSSYSSVKSVKITK